MYEDKFNKEDANQSSIYLGVERKLFNATNGQSSYFVRVLKTNRPQHSEGKVKIGLRDGDLQGPILNTLVDIPLPWYLSIHQYRLQPVNKTTFALIYLYNSVFHFELYSSAPNEPPKDIVQPLVNISYNPTYKRTKRPYFRIQKFNFTLVVIPGYWTSSLKPYTARGGQSAPNQGILIILAYKEKSTIQEFWWSVDSTNTFKVFLEHNVFLNLVAQTRFIDCGSTRRYTQNSDKTRLKPNQVRFKCYISATGAFDYLTEYIIDITKDLTPLISNKVISKIYTLKGFFSDGMEALPNTLIVRMSNINPLIKINDYDVTKCPYIVAVYRTNITQYPWTIYSCKDLRIKSNTQKPHFTSFRYQGENFLWIESRAPLPDSSLQKLMNSDLKQIKIISQRSIHNSTIRFLKNNDFSNLQLTIKTLNGNLMLKRLGLLNGMFMTEFTIDPMISPIYWYTFLGIIFALIAIFGFLVDLMNRKVRRVLLGRSKKAKQIGVPSVFMVEEGLEIPSAPKKKAGLGRGSVQLVRKSGDEWPATGKNTAARLSLRLDLDAIDSEDEASMSSGEGTGERGLDWRLKRLDTNDFKLS